MVFDKHRRLQFFWTVGFLDHFRLQRFVDRKKCIDNVFVKLSEDEVGQ
jgi:hypothetical protein